METKVFSVPGNLVKLHEHFDHDSVLSCYFCLTLVTQSNLAGGCSSPASQPHKWTFLFPERVKP